MRSDIIQNLLDRIVSTNQNPVGQFTGLNLFIYTNILYINVYIYMYEYNLIIYMKSAFQ